MEEIKCLDYGFVRLVDHMGDDSSIVQAARVSYGTGTKTIQKDRGLIRYLMRNRHTSPFEMCEIKFHCKMPIFVARQIIRHRTANVNEYSGRYSVMKEEWYTPRELNIQSEENKQQSSNEKVYENEELCTGLSLTSYQANDYYKVLLKKGVSREQARLILPLNQYTEWYWKIDLHNLFHFLKLRLDHHAQYETRVYAEAIARITKELYPVAYEAFEDYVLGSVTFSKNEIKALDIDLRFDDQCEGCEGLPKREFKELKDKLDKMYEV